MLPPLLRIFAATCLPALKAALDDVAGRVEGAVVVASEEGSIKTAERMVEAMKSEIAKKHQAEEGAGWQPVSALVRDALRASRRLADADARREVTEEIARYARDFPGPIAEASEEEGARALAEAKRRVRELEEMIGMVE